MQSMLAAYVAAAFVMAGLDLAWLSRMGDTFYRANLAAVMASKANVPAAIAFYLLYIVGIVIFGVRPALATGSWQSALIGGALFGFFCYMTYDLTNLATLKSWSMKVTLIDIGWGCFVTSLSAVAGYWAGLATR
jgi:uncharacterized membrane protein